MTVAIPPNGASSVAQVYAKGAGVNVPAGAEFRGTFFSRYWGPVVNGTRALPAAGSPTYRASIPDNRAPGRAETWIGLLDTVFDLRRSADQAVGKISALAFGVDGADGVPFDLEVWGLQTSYIGAAPGLVLDGEASWFVAGPWRVMGGKPVSVEVPTLFNAKAPPIALALIAILPDGVTLPDGVVSFWGGCTITFPPLVVANG